MQAAHALETPLNLHIVVSNHAGILVTHAALHSSRGFMMDKLSVVLNLLIHQQEKSHQHVVLKVVSGETGLPGQRVLEHVEPVVVRQERDLA